MICCIRHPDGITAGSGFNSPHKRKFATCARTKPNSLPFESMNVFVGNEVSSMLI